jgi:hypothetical protein
MYAAAVAVLAISAAVFWRSNRGPDTLTVILRCHGIDDGTLAITMLSTPGRGNEEREFDLRSSCAAGRLTLEGYRSNRSIRLRLRSAGKQVAELIASPGENIQAERHGYYAVVRLGGAPPTLANDTL